MPAKKRPTMDEIRHWPPTIDVGHAAEALGVSRAHLYTAIGAGQCPVAVIRIGPKRFKISTASLIRVLEGAGDGPAAAAPEAAEDAADIADADAAWDEPGDDVPWEQVKAELGPVSQEETGGAVDLPPGWRLDPRRRVRKRPDLTATP